MVEGNVDALGGDRPGDQAEAKGEGLGVENAAHGCVLETAVH